MECDLKQGAAKTQIRLTVECDLKQGAACHKYVLQWNVTCNRVQLRHSYVLHRTKVSAPLGCYAGLICSYIPTFRDDLSVPF